MAPATLSRSATALARRTPTVLYPISMAAPRRTFASSQPAKAGTSHESHYDPPTGWLFGVKPGEKYEKEGWENIFLWGFGGSFAFATIAYAFKPDTSIQTWALEEARRRLEAEGILADPDNEKKE